MGGQNVEQQRLGLLFDATQNAPLLKGHPSEHKLLPHFLFDHVRGYDGKRHVVDHCDRELDQVRFPGPKPEAHLNHKLHARTAAAAGCAVRSM